MIIEHIHEFYTGIFRRKFFHFFFHWSWQIRNMMFYLTLFIVNHKIKNMKFPKLNRLKIPVDKLKTENSSKKEPVDKMEIVIKINNLLK